MTTATTPKMLLLWRHCNKPAWQSTTYFSHQLGALTVFVCVFTKPQWFHLKEHFILTVTIVWNSFYALSTNIDGGDFCGLKTTAQTNEYAFIETSQPNILASLSKYMLAFLLLINFRLQVVNSTRTVVNHAHFGFNRALIATLPS